MTRQEIKNMKDKAIASCTTVDTMREMYGEFMSKKMDLR